MAHADPEIRRQRDRARIARRTAERIEAGLCTRCGRTGPAPERRLCAPCNEKQNRAGRARDARLRAGRKPRRDPERARRHGRERDRRLYAERAAAGICTRCGREPARPDRTTCGPCAEKHRERDRARDARARAQGMPYGGRDPEARRKAGRERSRRRSEARQAAGLCVRCGNLPPEDGRTMCRPCREDRRQAKRRRHADRRAAGVCVRCRTPTFGGAAYCAPCAVADSAGRNPQRKNAQSRRRYRFRRERGLCTACGAPAQGAARCPPCAEKSCHGSAHFKGIPVWDPTWIVIELETGREHGPFDSEADVALCLAFEKLDRDEVEIVADISPMARFASWA